MNQIDNRQIRVFISSTFQDMQGERDYLMKRTFPKLREMASKRGVMLTELDLRWGITDEESKSGRVVDICLREIENSIPFFIGIIGNRYGWVPEAKDLGDGVTDRFPAVTHYLEKRLSVTEMEMQFGVLERQEDMHAFFYIKEPETESDNPGMLRRLKEAVRSSRYPSSSYTTLADLARQVESAFITLLDELFPEENLSGHQKERMVQQSFIRKLSMTYIKDQKNFEQLTRFAEDPSHSYLVVTGESGVGKSAFLANWAKENEHGEHFSVIPFFLSNGGNQPYSSILSYVSEEMVERFGLSPVTEDVKEPMTKLLDQFSVRDDRLVIVIDAINQIADVEQAKRLNWLPVLPNNVKIVFSSLQDDGTMEVFKNRDYPVFVLKKLRKEQRHRLVKEYLSRNFGKNLQETQIRRIIEDKQCENTLVLKTLLDEIICNGRHDILDQQISYYLGSDSVADFYERVIIRYEEDFGKEFVKMVLGLLAVSRNGLSEDQLITMARIKQLDWSAFYCSFSTHLNNQSGRLVFTHNFITRTVWNRYMEKDSAFENACRWTIVRGLIKVQDDNAMQEVPFQLDKLKDWDQLHDYIATYRYLVYCMDFDELEIGAYWRHIFSALSDRYSLTDYLQDRPSNDEDAVQMYIKLLRLCVVLYKIKPKKIFVDELNKIIEAHPELASAKVYQALSASLSGPDDGVTVDDALRYANLSLELCRKEHDTLGEIESLRLLGSCYYWLAVRAKREDCAKKAFDVWEEALHLSIALYGEVHPLVMHAYKDMGLMCDDLDKALELTLKAVELGKMIYGKDHPLLGRPYHYVGCIYREMKRWNEALHYFEEACRVWLPAYGLNHEIMVSSYGNQGKCLMNMNRYDEALKCYDTNLRILAAIYDKPTYDYAVTQLNRAKILLALGRKEESLQACDEIEATLKNESVSAEERSKDLEKYYKDFRKTIA